MFAAEVARSLDDNSNDVGASVAVSAKWYAVAREFERGTGLCAGRDFHGDGAVDGLDFDFAAKGGVNHTDVLLG